MGHLDVVTPDDARQLLRDLEARGLLLVKMLPPSANKAGERGRRAPALLLARPESTAGVAGAAARAGRGSRAQLEAGRHFWPALDSAYECWESAMPLGCRNGSEGV